MNNHIKHRFFLKSIILFIYIAIIGAACTIPFYFESPSIFYKTGLDKLLLRSGKIIGIIAVVLMILQLVLVARLSCIEHVFSLKKLYNFHRISGLVLLAAALVHPVLVLGADHFVFFSFELKYWAEFVGIILLIMLIFFVLISHWQKRIGISYKTWRLLHKNFAPVLFVLMAVHVFNVSRTFETGVPFCVLWVAMALVFFLVIRKYRKHS